MLVAQRAQALQVTLRRNQHAGRAGDRLDDDGGDGFRAVQRDQTLDVVGELRAVRGLAPGEGVAGEIVGVADMIDARKMRRELPAVVDDAADRHAAETDPMIAALAADQAGARRLAGGTVIGQRDLQRGIDRLRTGIGEEDAVEPLGRDRRQLLGEIERDRMAHLERRRIIQRHQLPLHRVRDLAPAVTGVHAPQSGRSVDHFAAVDGRVVHAFGGGEQSRLGLELPVCRERHPERVKVLRVGNLVNGHVRGSCAAVSASTSCCTNMQQVLFCDFPSH